MIVACFCGAIYEDDPDLPQPCPQCRTLTNIHPLAAQPWQTLEDELDDLIAGQNGTS